MKPGKITSPNSSLRPLRPPSAPSAVSPTLSLSLPHSPYISTTKVTDPEIPAAPSERESGLVG